MFDAMEHGMKSPSLNVGDPVAEDEHHLSGGTSEEMSGIEDYGPVGSSCASRLSKPSIPPDSAPSTTLSSGVPIILCTCCGPKALFFIGMMAIAMIFMIVPIVSAMAMSSSYDYASTAMPDHLYNFLKWTLVVVNMNSMHEVAHLFAYYGEYLPSSLLTTSVGGGLNGATTTIAAALSSSSFSGEEVGISLMNGYIAVILESLDSLLQLGVGNTSGLHDLQSRLLVMEAQSLRAFSVKVIREQDTLKKANNARQMRDLLINANFTPVSTAAVSRPPQLVQVVKTACYGIASCWEGDGRTTIEEIEMAVGELVSLSSEVIINLFSVIETPNKNCTNLQELVERSLTEQHLRDDAMAEVLSRYATVEGLLRPFIQFNVATSSDGMKSVYFIAKKGWAQQLLTSCNESGMVAYALNENYRANSPVQEWISTGGAGVLSINEQNDNLLSATNSFASFFSYEIGESLVLNLTEEKTEELSAAFYAAKINKDFTETLALARELQEDAYQLMMAFAWTEAASVPTVEVSLVSAVSALLSVMLYLWVAAVVRYRVADSSFPFTSFLGALALMCVVQLGMTALIAYTSIHSKSLYQEVNVDVLHNISDVLYYTMNATNNVGTILKAALLIGPSDHETTATIQEVLENRPILTSLAAGRKWVSNYEAFLDQFVDLYLSGFYPVRQQLSSSSTLDLTMDELADIFDIGELESMSATPEPIHSCLPALAATALAALATNYVDLSAVSEALSIGTVNIDAVPSGSVVPASFEGVCESAMLAAVNASGDVNGTCFVASVCGQPSSSYGMLRSTAGVAGLFSLFDPTHVDFMGTLVQTWQQLVSNDFPSDVNEQYTGLIQASKADQATVGRSRREVVWYGSFTCLALQLASICVWQLLFGTSYFNKFA